MEFPPEIASNLIRHGFSRFDNALSSSAASKLRYEIDSLADQGYLRENCTHVVREGGATETFRKKHMFEAELNMLPTNVIDSLPHLNQLRHDDSIRTLLSVFAPRLTLHTHAIKIQKSEGMSACFPVHIDSTPSKDNRIVTCLLYVGQGWEESHGGQLRVYESPTSTVDIDPIEGRLVLMSSTNLHHRVLPAKQQRYVITMWCSGKVRSCPKPNFLELNSDERIATYLLQPKNRDMAFRLLLVEEWERSLWEAHEENEAREAVGIHRKTLDIIRDRLPQILKCELSLPGDVSEVRSILESPVNLLNLYKRVDPLHTSFRW